jgi:beta-mannosidase
VSRLREQLSDGWEVARTEPGQLPDAAADLDGLSWTPARVPGTVALALGDAAAGVDLDAHDWWFRVRFQARPVRDGERVALGLDGLATIAEVYLNGEPLLASESMFSGHETDVGPRLRDVNELAICCRALVPRLRERRRPRARWRTALVAEGNLRFHRTMLLGRAPGFAPGPPVVGPWRPVWLERRQGPAVQDMRLRTRVHGTDGILECRARLAGPAPAEIPVTLRTPAGDVHASELEIDAETGIAAGALRVPEVELWWPHTHGDPALYDVTIGEEPLHVARIGFRRLEAAPDIAADGLQLRLNGVPVFARGAVWTPVDLRSPHAAEADLRPVLERVVAGGMNMLRIPGTATYESPEFYDLCDELGILVWQDFMFANLDYPEADEAFMATVAGEARAVLSALGARPCLAVLCGGSEVAQQVAMLGLDPGLADGPLFGELLPRLVAEAEVDAPYVPSAPWGGDLPFRTDRGVANYYGVGAYRRPLEDARRAEVRFATECLAFANLPDEPTAWKAGVARDVGAGWDFEDVRDHYLTLLFGVDPVALRSFDPERYLELSRAVSGEIMAEVLGEWRRAGSPCGGALILWLKDLFPGAGWGVLDHRGAPKVAYHHLRRVLAPTAVWMTDEGLGGIDVHVANDRGEPLAARLRLSLYREDRLVDEAVAPVSLGSGEALTQNVETVLGRFVDASWAYRFGPPSQDLVVASLEEDSETKLLSQAFRFPAGRPLQPRSAEELGVSAVAETSGEGGCVRVGGQRLLYGVRLELPGYLSSDDAFCVEPGRHRHIILTPAGEPAREVAGSPALTALNLRGRVRIAPAP